MTAMDYFSIALICGALILMMDGCSALPYNTQPNYYGRPRDERCPPVSEEQIICPQHSRSCSLAKLDGCNSDGMYCCEDKCNNAICYDRRGTALHSEYYRTYESNRGTRTYNDHHGGVSGSQYNSNQDSSYERSPSRNQRNMQTFG